jgi:UDP:flavonoid glycosyltransferase YjiC (YdhE family)
LKDTLPETIRNTVQTALSKLELKDGAKVIKKSFHSCGGASEAADFIV